MIPVMEGKEKPEDAALCSFGYSFFALCFLGSVFVFALLSVSLPSPSPFPCSLSYVTVPSLPQHLWGFWHPVSQCCNFDQGKCGSLAKYTAKSFITNGRIVMEASLEILITLFGFLSS